eukprot:359243-Chlamydomonas_euryale.AAC.6
MASRLRRCLFAARPVAAAKRSCAARPKVQAAVSSSRGGGVHGHQSWLSRVGARAGGEVCEGFSFWYRVCVWGGVGVVSRVVSTGWDKGVCVGVGVGCRGWCRQAGARGVGGRWCRVSFLFGGGGEGGVSVAVPVALFVRSGGSECAGVGLAFRVASVWAAAGTRLTVAARWLRGVPLA